MVGRARTFTAALLLVLPAGIGLGAAPAHAVEFVDPDGGCWSYVPDRTLADDAIYGPAPETVTDISTALEPWGTGTTLTIETSGATVAGEGRAVSLALANGPVMPAAASEATAVATFTVVAEGAPADAPAPVPQRLTTTFAAVEGEPVDSLTFEGGLTGLSPGGNVVRLESVHFDLPGTAGAPGVMVVCNGQTEGQPSAGGGVNPATTPVTTKVFESFTAVGARTVAIDDVRGQGVTSAARAGDGIEVRATGLDSSAPFSVELCAASCTVLGSGLVVGADGTGSASVTVPAGLTAGAALVRVAQGTGRSAELPLTVLGPQAFVANEVKGDGRVDVSLTGTNWDPKATVVVEGLAQGDVTSDAAKEVTVDDQGSFHASFTATVEGTTALRLTQERADGFKALTARHKLTNAVAPASDGGKGKGDQGGQGDGSGTGSTGSTGSSTSTPTTSTPTTSVPSAAPVDIPLPEEKPVDEVTDPVVAPVDDQGALEEGLKVSEARLAGEASLAEMFGGSSRREVTFLAENVGETVISNPLVRLGVGREEGVDPVIVAAEVGDLQPGARVAVAVDVALPMASFGTYRVVGQVGDSEDSRFTLEWQTYPWGLIALNLLGVALLAWGVWRRRQRSLNPTPMLAGADDEEAGASVVDLTALDQWWKTGKVAAQVVVPDDNDSVVDLDAADRWWAKRGSRVS